MVLEYKNISQFLNIFTKKTLIEPLKKYYKGAIMVSKFIDKLKAVVAKYPYPKIHKILAYLICAMLKIRNYPEYMTQSIQMVALAERRMSKIILKLSEEIQDEFRMEILDITNVILVFSSLTDEEVGFVAEYCKTIIPISNNPLETFLIKHFNSTTTRDISPFENPFFKPAQAALIETLTGFYDEKFILHPENEVSNKEVVRAIIDFYGKMGFLVSYQKEDYSVCVKKGSELIDVVFSNDRAARAIRITVESIG
jgi:hypothetical protein